MVVGLHGSNNGAIMVIGIYNSYYACCPSFFATNLGHRIDLFSGSINYSQTNNITDTRDAFISSQNLATLVRWYPCACDDLHTSSELYCGCSVLVIVHLIAAICADAGIVLKLIECEDGFIHTLAGNFISVGI